MDRRFRDTIEEEPGYVADVIDPIAPGRQSITSRYLLRARRDSNGVIAGAADVVDRAVGSSGHGLPDDLRARFESSVGVDLSHVRVHTGDDSANAADAVGARAYTLGSDIHFARGHYDPTSASGQFLIAHEVAHTVQQAGAAQRKAQFKLEVSSPGDALEVEADQAASAMLAGQRAAISNADSALSRKVMRGPNNSYSEGKGLKWDGGGDLSDEENKQWAEKQAAFAQKAAGFVAKKLGFDSGKVIDGMKKRIKQDIADRQAYIDNLKKQLEDGKKNGRDTSDIQKTYDSEVKKLENVKGSSDDVITKANEMAGKANEVIGSVAGVGKAIQSASGGKIETTMFKSMADVNEKIENVGKLVSAAHQIYDTQNALTAFQANPTFDTAAAWGNAVGAAFDEIAKWVPKLPMGWDTVISGALQTPKVVIAAFISISKSYYARVDEMSKDPASHGAKILKDGESG